MERCSKSEAKTYDRKIQQTKNHAPPRCLRSLSSTLLTSALSTSSQHFEQSARLASAADTMAGVLEHMMHLGLFAAGRGWVVAEGAAREVDVGWDLRVVDVEGRFRVVAVSATLVVGLGTYPGSPLPSSLSLASAISANLTLLLSGDDGSGFELKDGAGEVNDLVLDVVENEFGSSSAPVLCVPARASPATAPVDEAGCS